MPLKAPGKAGEAVLRMQALAGATIDKGRAHDHVHAVGGGRALTVR